MPHGQAAKHKVGPNLHAFERQAGSRKRYSKGLKTAGFAWDAELLDRYLTNPRKMIKGGRMVFPGLKKERDARMSSPTSCRRWYERFRSSCFPEKVKSPMAYRRGCSFSGKRRLPAFRFPPLLPWRNFLWLKNRRRITFGRIPSAAPPPRCQLHRHFPVNSAHIVPQNCRLRLFAKQACYTRRSASRGRSATNPGRAHRCRSRRRQASSSMRTPFRAWQRSITYCSSSSAAIATRSALTGARSRRTRCGARARRRSRPRAPGSGVEMELERRQRPPSREAETFVVSGRLAPSRSAARRPVHGV